MLLSIHFRLYRFCALTAIGLISTSLLATVPAHAQFPYAISELLPDRLSQAPSLSPEQPSLDSTWQAFTSATGHYAVDFPALPAQFTSTTEVPEGTLTWQVAETRLQAVSRSNSTSNPNSYEYYMIAYTTLSDDHLANRNPDELLQSISDAVLTEGELNENIQLQEPILFHNNPARLVIGAANDQYWVMIVSLVNGRIYTNLAFSQQRDRVIHFLDSFVFTDFPS